MFEIAGVHHVAIGVNNPEAMTVFYTDVLEFQSAAPVPQPAPQAVMSDITRGVIPVFSASMLSRSAGGILVEFIHMHTPAPQAIRQDFHYGDIGVNKMTLAVADVKTVYQELKNKINFCSSPRSVEIPGWGVYHFLYIKDPEGNLIELASGTKLPVKNRFGGVISIGISVTDLKR
jgi:catechol 2,3-dioxygenase-like lactoylglutathione lyase family enzyme